MKHFCPLRRAHDRHNGKAHPSGIMLTGDVVGGGHAPDTFDGNITIGYIARDEKRARFFAKRVAAAIADICKDERSAVAIAIAEDYDA